MGKDRIEFEFDNSLGRIKLGLMKKDVINRARKFSKKSKFEVLESEHNILIKQKEFDEEFITSHIALFTFDDNEKLIAIRLNMLKKLDFKGIRVNDNELVVGHENIMKLIERGENYEVSSSCPILNKTINFKTKECDIEYYANCLECEHRSQQRIESEFKEFNCIMSYDVDYKKSLSIIDFDFGYNAYDKFWFTDKYGNTEIK